MKDSWAAVLGQKCNARGKPATGSMFLTFLDVYVKSREALHVKLHGQLQCLCKHKNKTTKYAF